MAHLSPVRTPPLGDLASSFRLWGQASMATTVLAVLLGLTFFGLAWSVASVWAYYPLLARLQAIGFALVVSPVLALPVLVAALPMILWAFIKGYAGWSVCVACGVIAATVALLLIERFVWHPEIAQFGIVLGTFFGLLFWAATRLYDPTPRTIAA